MGLDNEFMIKKHQNPWVNKILYRAFIHEKYRDMFSVAYYRKCWNVRSLVFEVLDYPSGCMVDEWQFPVNQKQIKRIIKSLKALNEDNWTDEGGSIWTFEEMEEHLKADIKRLKRLYFLMFFLDLEVHFEDSY